jgi:hypothetical protein
MRRHVTPERLQTFMRELAGAARSRGKVYFTGGATALLLGFRQQTIDIDIKFEPEPQGVFEAIAILKHKLDVNVELAAPSDFIPAPPDWQERSTFITAIGQVEFYHFVLSLQALAKLERGHAQDLRDVRDLLRRRLVTAEELSKTYGEIEPMLVRYPAIDPGQFKNKVERFLASYNEP